MADIREALTKKIGPLPAVAWLGIVGGAIFVARRMGSAEDAPEYADEDLAEGEGGFPSGQLRPVVGEHESDFPPVWWPTPENPLPVRVDPPDPLPGSQPPTAGIPSFWFYGKRWHANQRGAFSSYIKSRRPLGYRTLREWIHGVKKARGRSPRPGHLSTARKMGWI